MTFEVLLLLSGSVIVKKRIHAKCHFYEAVKCVLRVKGQSLEARGTRILRKLLFRNEAIKRRRFLRKF